MAIEISRVANTHISVKTQATGNHLTVEHLLWFAREVQEAVDAGMPGNTQVQLDNPTGVNGVTLRAKATLSQEIP